MGPRPIRRGNGTLTLREDDKGLGFNGATSNQTWKPQVTGLQVGLSNASMGPRPIRRGNIGTLTVLQEQTLLQWGHVQSDVETSTNEGRRSKFYGFNGATSNQTWKLSRSCPV